MKISVQDLILFCKQNSYQFENFEPLALEIELSFSSISNSKPNSISWTKENNINATQIQSSVLICEETAVFSPLSGLPLIRTVNPRLCFTKLLSYATGKVSSNPEIAKTAVIHPLAKIASTVSVGEFTVIGKNVEIGDYTNIGNHVVIAEGVKIGNHCRIKSNSVIGENGFGYQDDEVGNPLFIPHIGSVRIGNQVDIGANCVIARGTLDDTLVGDFVKIDDLVFIAHNCSIGRFSKIIACAEISGSVTVGERSWIGPNSSIIDRISLGDKSFIGIGALVNRSTNPEMVVPGNFCKYKEKESN